MNCERELRRVGAPARELLPAFGFCAISKNVLASPKAQVLNSALHLEAGRVENIYPS